MAKKKPALAPSLPSTPPRIHEAILGKGGAIIKGKALTQAEAETMRKAGQDVVVAGENLSANRSLAGAIEKRANVKTKRCPPHPSAGKNALPHYQPDPRPPEGHTFYETPKRKAL